MQTGWRPVTPFDPLLAIRQKRDGKAPPEDPPKTRENRITAVGNDLYSADSRSFLNPFLRISQGVRAFFHRTLDGTPIHRLLSPSAADPAPPPLPLIPSFSVSGRTCVQVPRALRETEIALSRKSRSLLLLRIVACVTHTRTLRVRP